MSVAPTGRDWRDDGALMALAAGGDAAAFGEIVSRHAVVLHRAAYRMMFDQSEAEDVVQDAFARLWVTAPRWRPSGGGVGGWLYRVATNLCLDRLGRRRFGSGADLPDIADERPDAALTIDRDRLSDTIGACLAALPDRQRAAIVLTYYEGLANAVVAEALAMNIKAFESLLLRARAALGRSLAARGVTAADAETLAGAEA